SDLPELSKMLCDRRLGVGADGLLALNAPETSDVDYTMAYRNADGSDAGMCGNGARCLALFAFSKGLQLQQRFNVHDKVYEAKILSQNEVSISFPIETRINKIENLPVSPLYQVFTGTEHVVSVVDEPQLEETDKLRETGRRIRNHKKFKPTGTNVNFISGVGDDAAVRIRTFEKGVENLTLACGTGAIAGALVWHHLHPNSETPKRMTLQADGGNLTVSFSYNPETETYSDIRLEGPAHFVFDGTYHM
ncbi:MAG: diaminopimelate epimerase, partial [Balneolaceae bacterium]